MLTNRRVLNKKSKCVKLLLLVSLLFAICFSVMLQGTVVRVYGMDGSISEQAKQKVYSTASIEDDFTDDVILVGLTKEATLEFKQYTIADFPELNLSSVSEMTDILVSRVKQQIRNEHLGIVTNSNVDNFRRILKLELSESEQSKENILEAIKILEKRYDIGSASPNYIGEFYSVSSNDSYAGSQWAINNIQLSEAWNLTTGSNQVRVGIVDSGIDRNHPDLVGRINENLSRDHSGGGNPWTGNNGHGTHTAGIVGATGDNNIGVVGTNWNAELVSLKVGDNGPTAVAVTEAILYAEANDIRILSMSLSVNETTAMNHAINAFNGLIVAAAGNSGNTNVGYPARLNNPRIISVGSIESNNTRSSFSCWGTVDIWAPGGSILSTWPTALTAQHDSGRPGYRTESGTSMATPYVAGVAALMLSVAPDLTFQQLQTNIIDSGNWIDIKHPSGFLNLGSTTITVKKLNAYEAVKSVMTIINYDEELLDSTYNQDSKIFDRINISLSRDEYKWISFTPSITNDCKLQYWSDHTIDMQILEKTSSGLNMIFESNNTNSIIQELNNNITYYIRLSYEDETNEGMIDFSIISPDSEINNSVQTISLFRQTEYLKFVPLESGFYSIYTTEYVYMQIYDANYEPLFNNYDNSTLISIYNFTEGNTYYISVSSYVSVTLEFTIDIIANFQTIVEKDANNDQMIYRESISIYGEVKLYKFTPSDTGLYSFKTIASNNGNTYMELYDNNGTLLAVDDDSGDIWSAKISYSLIGGVDYYFSVRYKYYSSTGQYDLEVYKQRIEWILDWTKISKSYFDPMEATYITNETLPNWSVWTMGYVDTVNEITRTITFSRLECRWSISYSSLNPESQVLMQIGATYTESTGLLWFMCMNGYYDDMAVTPDTMCYYDESVTNVSITFSETEWNYLINSNYLYSIIV